MIPSQRWWWCPYIQRAINHWYHSHPLGKKIYFTISIHWIHACKRGPFPLEGIRILKVLWINRENWKSIWVRFQGPVLVSRAKKILYLFVWDFFFSFFSFHCLFGFNNPKHLKQYYEIASQTLTLLWSIE